MRLLFLYSAAEREYKKQPERGTNNNSVEIISMITRYLIILITTLTNSMICFSNDFTDNLPFIFIYIFKQGTVVAQIKFSKDRSRYILILIIIITGITTVRTVVVQQPSSCNNKIQYLLV